MTVKIKRWIDPDNDDGFSTPSFYRHECPLCHGIVTIYEKVYSDKITTSYQSKCIRCSFSAPMSEYCIDQNEIWTYIRQANDNFIDLKRSLEFSHGFKEITNNYLLTDIKSHFTDKNTSLNDKINAVVASQHMVGEAKFQILSQQLRQIQSQFHEGLETCDKTIVNMVTEQTDKRIVNLLIQAKENGTLNLSDLTMKLEKKDEDNKGDKT